MSSGTSDSLRNAFKLPPHQRCLLQGVAGFRGLCHRCWMASLEAGVAYPAPEVVPETAFLYTG
jgi:hypothetical protein